MAADAPIPVEPPFYSFPLGNGTLREFMHGAKLTIADIPNTTFIDYHMTETGNKILAEIIYNNLMERHNYD